METIRTLQLAGFNRHGDIPVLERWITASAETLDAIENGAWLRAFYELQLSVAGKTPAFTGADDGSRDCAGRLAASTITLQQAAGFQVSHHGALTGSRSAPIRFFAEYDLEEGGLAAMDLVMDLLSTALAGDAAEQRLQSLKSRFDSLCELARLRATPADTRALIDAARRCEIPVYRMDRRPYEPIHGAFRVRPHGLLRLGQGRHQCTVDGTFAIERSESLHSVIRNRAAMFNLLKELRFSLPLAVGSEIHQFASPARAIRAARRAGFPVVLKSVQRRTGGVVTNLHDEQAVSDAAIKLLAGGAAFVEPFIAGEVIELVYVGQRRFAALRRRLHGSMEWMAIDEVPDATLSAADKLAHRLELACLSIAFVSEAPNPEGRATVIDVDPAPRLDRLLRDMPGLLERAGDLMIDWLFPAGRKSRIPIAAITGTNGKTTTCLMVDRIMRETGIQTGLACSTGAYLDGREMDRFEDGYLPGHLTVIDKSSVAMAILETTRGSAISTGIGFELCDVAACLNVSNDHLGDEMEIRTLDELAKVKQWIVERGRRVVLNADDPRCLAMARELRERRPVLVSCSSSAAALSSAFDSSACVVESVDGRDWIVLHEGPSSVPIIPVEGVPAAFGGRAVHNVSNALHAAAIAHLMGADAASIAAGLSGIRPDARDMPGRLNHYCSDGIDVILDYAHNPEGLARLASFCDRLEVRGRRLIAVTLPANRGDDFVREGVGGVAGRFDHYICKNYGIRYGREPHEVPELLRSGLERVGVSGEQITLIEDERTALAHTLEMSRPGDLVVLIVGKDFRELGRMVETFLNQRGGRSVA